MRHEKYSSPKSMGKWHLGGEMTSVMPCHHSNRYLSYLDKQVVAGEAVP